MTASTLSQPLLMAGSVLMAQLGRGARWSFERYMRAPLASTGIFALVTLSALASSNALYFQTGVHPSPFFATSLDVPRAVKVSPVEAPMPAPATMREQAEQDAAAVAPLAAPTPTPQTTGGVAAAPAPQVIPDQPVGNSEVFAVQKKLAELKLFEGKVDGYYGPMTARAIRAFEERNGFEPQGALSSGIVQSILNSDAPGRAAVAAQPQAAAEPVPVVQPQVQATVPVPAPVAARQPAPVVQAAATPAPQPQAAPQQDQVVARLPALSPVETAVDTVGTATASTIDSIVAAVEGGRGTPTPVNNPPVPTASVPTQPMPAPVQVQAAAAQPVAQIEPVAQPVAITPTQPARAARPATDGDLVADIQRGLASLGFFRGQIDGNPGPETARAIREFENFHRYKITGQVQPDLVDLLRKAGATI